MTWKPEGEKKAKAGGDKNPHSGLVCREHPSLCGGVTGEQPLVKCATPPLDVAGGVLHAFRRPLASLPPFLSGTAESIKSDQGLAVLHKRRSGGKGGSELAFQRLDPVQLSERWGGSLAVPSFEWRGTREQSCWKVIPLAFAC